MQEPEMGQGSTKCCLLIIIYSLRVMDTKALDSYAILARNWIFEYSIMGRGTWESACPQQELLTVSNLGTE